MKTSIKQINGNWDLGYALDKHVLSSVFLGHNANGHPEFDTTRSEVGEALYQLKYRSDWNQVDPLANQLAVSIYPKFSNVGFIIPMPASKVRARQLVTEVAHALGLLIGKPVFDNLIIKTPTANQLKDISTREEKLKALHGSFSVHDAIAGQGPWNALLIDDLFDTGASAEMACTALRSYPKIRNIYVAVLTWK